MKRIAGMFAATVLAALSAGTARADVPAPTFLVASSQLDGSPFEQTVIVAAPVSDGRHIGFIINRRTSVTLGTLFPDDPAARNVTSPVYVGGPVLPQVVFALTSHVPENAQSFVPLAPGVYAVLDSASVHRLVETAPNDARYFVGLMIWDRNELEEQIRSGFWEAHPTGVRGTVPGHPVGIWTALRSIPTCIDERAGRHRARLGSTVRSCARSA
jgi:putative AlgH/UPF0301 family transcriptional regulator